MFSFRQKGDFRKTEKLLKKAMGDDYLKALDEYGRKGVSLLSAVTPVDTGETAISWDYDIVRNGSGVSVEWHNSNVNKGVNIAIILQYGHGTRNGGYVVGRDYINPAIRPIFDELAEKAWKEVLGDV